MLKSLVPYLSAILLFAACRPDEAPPAGSDGTQANPPGNARVEGNITGILNDGRGIFTYQVLGIDDENVESGPNTTDDKSYFSYHHPSLEPITVLQSGGRNNFRIIAPVIVQPGRTHFIKKSGVLPTGAVTIRTGQSTHASQERFSIISGDSSWLINGRYLKNAVMAGSHVILSNQSELLPDVQPGDLRGITANGVPVVVMPYFIAGFTANVEETLGVVDAHVAPGKSIGVAFDIPQHARATAPQRLKCWELNYRTGTWVEHGVATRNDDKYYCQLSQKGYFCLGEAGRAVFVRIRLVDVNNNPMPFTPVVIQLHPGEPGRKWPNLVYTDNTGELCTYVPAGVKWSLDVRNLCDLAITSIPMQPVTSNVGRTVRMDKTGDNIEISGKAFSCQHQPLRSGVVKITSNTFSYQFPIKDGSYAFSLPTCLLNNGNKLHYQLFDSATHQLTAATELKMGNQRTIILPDANVCVDEKRAVKGQVEFTVDGQTYTLSTPRDSLFMLYYVPDGYTPPIAFHAVNKSSVTFLTVSWETLGAGVFPIYTMQARGGPSTPFYLNTWGIYKQGNITVEVEDRKKGMLKGSFHGTINRDPSVSNLHDTTTIYGTFDLKQ